MEVVQRKAVERSALRKLNPAGSEHTAVVYLTKRGEYERVVGRLTMAEIWLRTPKELFTVATSPQEDTFDLRLPSREEAFSFAASVRATWRVTDPVAAVKAQLTDPSPGVRRLLEERLREHTRGFDVEGNAEAERRFNLDYADRAVVVSDAVTITGCTVVLNLDEATTAHIADRTLVVRERQKHEYDKERDERKREREREDTKHDLALQETRMKQYADALQSGDHNALALLLAGHGEDANAVVQIIMQQRQLEHSAAREVLDRLLAANLVNRKDVGRIIESAGTALIGGVSDVRTPKSVESARPDRETDPDDEGFEEGT
ncbi:hypothetical protein GCM10022243_29750 [Saccharothrix violaceirubra]|uniref:PE-PGRS family protein n=1 Tax=Saccharothrix violaceirubra TaxID=413306 RepID=A0A7W7T4T0_9PSEU|nr:hypothetical protein [Saccharothrix violaceirubra]MBB4966599.1 hypothetical protein [Saccharothrix violaceirubra]